MDSLAKLLRGNRGREVGDIATIRAHQVNEPRVVHGIAERRTFVFYFAVIDLEMVGCGLNRRRRTAQPQQVLAEMRSVFLRDFCIVPLGVNGDKDWLDSGRRIAQIESVRFTIEYLDVFIRRDRATVHVWIDASFRMKPVLGDDGLPRVSPRVVPKQDFAKFELIREGDSWLITKGI